MKDLTTIYGMLAHSASVMDKLDKGAIDIDTAKAHAALLKQSNNLLRLDLDERKFKFKMTEVVQVGEPENLS
jgi:glutamate 5-kinase